MPTPLSELTDEQKKFYEMGFRDALDKRKVYVDFKQEQSMPIEWAEYDSDEQREVIASIVSMPEFQEYFKTNMMSQAMLKWRQARLAKDPEEVQLCFKVGNFIMELVEFYDHAPDKESLQTDEDNDGFNSFPEPR